VFSEEAGEAAKMIAVTVTEHEDIEPGRINAYEVPIVDERSNLCRSAAGGIGAAFVRGYHRNGGILSGGEGESRLIVILPDGGRRTKWTSTNIRRRNYWPTLA
jgi:hypothetical protein